MSDEKNGFKNVVCVKFNDKYAHHRKLVIGKTYLAQINSNVEYYISDNDNQSRNGLGFYSADLFVSVEEWRNIRLNELGI